MGRLKLDDLYLHARRELCNFTLHKFTAEVFKRRALRGCVENPSSQTPRKSENVNKTQPTLDNPQTMTASVSMQHTHSHSLHTSAFQMHASVHFTLCSAFCMQHRPVLLQFLYQ
jgi:hypothetical protein